MNKEYLLNIISQYRNKFNIYLLDNYGQTEYTLFHGNSDSKIAMEIATNHTSFVNSFVNNKDNEEDDFYFTVCLDFLLSLNSASFPFLKYNLQNSIKNYCNNII
jgi:hypothetical protein